MRCAVCGTITTAASLWLFLGRFQRSTLPRHAGAVGDPFPCYHYFVPLRVEEKPYVHHKYPTLLNTVQDCAVSTISFEPYCLPVYSCKALSLLQHDPVFKVLTPAVHTFYDAPGKDAYVRCSPDSSAEPCNVQR